MRLHQLTFTSEPFEGVTGSRWMTPVIDGVPLSDLVADFEAVFDVPERGGYAGIVVGASGDPLADTLLSAGAAVPVLGCGCGETECWPLDADIRFDDWSVTWDGFSQPFRPRWSYDGFGPFVFELGGYRRAVEGVRAGRG